MTLTMTLIHGTGSVCTLWYPYALFTPYSLISLKVLPLALTFSYITIHVCAFHYGLTTETAAVRFPIRCVKDGNTNNGFSSQY